MTCSICTRRNSQLGIPTGRVAEWAVRGTASNVCMAGTRSDRQSHRRMLRSHTSQSREPAPDASPQRDLHESSDLQLYISRNSVDEGA